MRLKRKFGIAAYGILIVILVFLLAFEIKISNKKIIGNKIAYTEKSDISYKVLLKEKKFYDDPYLGEGNSYIASMIDKFIVNYKYKNVFSDKVDYTLRYNIKARLTVYDSNNDSKPVYTKDYVLLEDQTITNNSRVAEVDIADQEINYDEYNNIINEIKREIIPNATLVINFNTYFKGKSSLISEDIISNKTSSFKIPISQRTINVDLQKNNTASNKTITDKKSISKPILVLVVVTIIFIVLVIINFIMYLIKTARKRTKYEQCVSKILREFDRAITEAKGKIRLDKRENLIEIKDFMELLDVHDNLNIPIIYYRLSSTASLFVIRNNSDVYYNLIKSDDFE